MKELVIQPAPGEARGRDTMLSSLRDRQGNLPAVSLGVDQNGNVSRLLFYFDLSESGLTADTTIVDASLILYPNSAFCSTSPISAHVYPVTRAWTEEGATWVYADAKTHWDFSGGDFAERLPIGGFWAEGMNLMTAQRIEIHLDPTTIQNWLNGYPNYGILIKSDTEGATGTIATFYSRKFGLNPSKRPQLKIIYK